jgi:uncharacterized protein
LKLHADSPASLNLVTGYGPGFVEVNRERKTGALLLRPEGPILPWAVSAFELLEAPAIEELLQHQPEIVLLGTGPRQRFPHPGISAALAGARIGLDVMDTPAACRTYNILVAEGRRVLAALLPT